MTVFLLKPLFYDIILAKRHWQEDGGERVRQYSIKPARRYILAMQIFPCSLTVKTIKRNEQVIALRLYWWEYVYYVLYSPPAQLYPRLLPMQILLYQFYTDEEEMSGISRIKFISPSLSFIVLKWISHMKYFVKLKLFEI